jgi:hypothetical protein
VVLDESTAASGARNSSAVSGAPYLRLNSTELGRSSARGSFLTRLRKKTRAERREIFTWFLADIRPTNDRQTGRLRIVDIGGTVEFWEKWWEVTDADGIHVTLINTHEVDISCRGQASQHDFIADVRKDATTLTTSDLQHYDVIFSNSFLEHLKTWSDQRSLAENIISSKTPYFIQVPNKHSPIDPHHPFVPFFALYPKWVRARLVTISSFGNPGQKAPSLAAAYEWQDGYTPLGVAEMQKLFPNATFKIERPLGIPMSIIAFQRGSVRADLC